MIGEMKAGDIVHLTTAASVQFLRPIFVRVIRKFPSGTRTRVVWIEGYELNAAGDAVARRELYVMRDGCAYRFRPRVAPPIRAARSHVPREGRPMTTLEGHKPLRPSWRCPACGIL